MDCLKRAIAWDEKRFGLKLDLEEYKIVAVGDFNSGAMENKGLNIFNTRYVLARADTATDVDYLNIDRVVAHEYFHNWTGNRVTCRDWFQLSLKEGLTVFRDQEYGADTYSRAVTRIQEVRSLRANQFPEDAGPMKHPVRPQSYMEIRNFYTMTVYEKGAEVVRMQHTLLGEEKFQAGMRLYFKRHDGQAVTCDDFVQAMQDASGIDLAQFKRWYDVAGHAGAGLLGDLSATASSRSRVKQSMNPPFHIPFAVKIGEHEQVLSLKQAEETFSFPVEGEAGAVAAARVLRAGDPRLSVQRGRPAAPDGAATTIPSTAGKPAQRLAASIILDSGRQAVGRLRRGGAQAAARSRPGVRRRGAEPAGGDLPRRADGGGRSRPRCTNRATRCAARSPRR